MSLTRNEIQQIIEDNSYDNLNKEILASMLRTIFEALKDNNYNLQEDELQGLKYNSTQTLSTFFATLPSIKKYRIGKFSLGVNGSIPVTVGSDDIQSATLRNIGSDDAIIDLNFNVGNNILNKQFFFGLETDSLGDTGLNAHNNLCMPVYRIQTTNQLQIGLREVSNSGGDFYLNIFMI